MFNRKEINMLHDPYFKVIREEEQFIEIQSINTGHCWNIFKHQLEREFKVTLYHKHKITDKYYHQHRKCHSVMKAIEEIKNHDAYVLEQLELRKEAALIAAQGKRTRKLKVYRGSGHNYRAIPMIMLKGDWLKKVGFNIGDKVNIECRADGKIVLSLEE